MGRARGSGQFGVVMIKIIIGLCMTIAGLISAGLIIASVCIWYLALHTNEAGFWVLSIASLFYVPCALHTLGELVCDFGE